MAAGQCLLLELPSVPSSKGKLLLSDPLHPNYRQKQLEDILVLAKQFHETTEPVSDWLSVTEKKLANSEPIGTQTAKIQQQISRHKVGPGGSGGVGALWVSAVVRWVSVPAILGGGRRGPAGAAPPKAAGASPAGSVQQKPLHRAMRRLLLHRRAVLIFMFLFSIVF